MGYTTQFEGELKFNRELKASEILKLQSVSGENPDDLAGWERRNKEDELSYIQYELNKTLDGLKWDGSEKFYCAVEALNFILHNLRKESPDLRLIGFLRAQGEELGDIWEIRIDEEGWAYRKELPTMADIVECPHCSEKFRLSEVL